MLIVVLKIPLLPTITVVAGVLLTLVLCTQVITVTVKIKVCDGDCGDGGVGDVGVGGGGSGGGDTIKLQKKPCWNH